ncbi:hypothetical protein K438DRAFT_2149621, partial [Mycena galopus ATCC 62051]
VPPDFSHVAAPGLIGLGTSEGSVVYNKLDSTEGNTVLDNIFLQNTATLNFITFALSHLNDSMETWTGDFTIGETITESNFSAVTNQPKLPVTVLSGSNTGNQHFQMLLDADGFIGPDGVVIDTGFSAPQVPRRVCTAEHINVPDSSSGQVWIVPCTQEVNITLKFGGITYPVNPIDTAIDPTIRGLPTQTTASGSNACIGLFQPVSFDVGSDPTYDVIFGMAFLRNVYTLINFGDFIVGSTSKAYPCIQLLSLTDPAQAHAEFVKVRLGGVDTTTSILTSNGKINTKNTSTSPGLSKKTYITIAAALLLSVIIGSMFRSTRASRGGVYRPSIWPPLR